MVSGLVSCIVQEQCTRTGLADIPIGSYIYRVVLESGHCIIYGENPATRSCFCLKYTDMTTGNGERVDSQAPRSVHPPDSGTDDGDSAVLWRSFSPTQEDKEKAKQR